MVKLSEIIKVRDDIVFGGAVQVDWFYQEKAKLIAENFVFHGPDFFGVTEGDIEYSDHKLMDTCSYSKLISDKLSGDSGNPIMLTIAGYGTGKSHLAVTLGKLFEYREVEVSRKVLDNLRKADSNLANDIGNKINKKNLVLVLNGMRDFNLNIEILNVARKVLYKHGYNDEFFSDITKAYTIAKIFIERNYKLHEKLFLEEFKNTKVAHNLEKDSIIESIFNDEVFNAVNNIYEKINGTRIRWDEGITASEILRKLNEKLCGENGEFNKILILFDEFGRYIEFAADRPELAGDSALQQIYETIQDADNGIIMVGFIQSDLKTYMARVKKSSSIARYIGRYESGEKLYLSSNLETIFANLISRTDKHLFDEYITRNIDSIESKEKNSQLFMDINKWSSYVNTKGLWKEKKKFDEVIIKGTYPLNPLSVLLLTSLSNWYQQRSALNFFMDSIKIISDKEIVKLGILPQIYPIDIIKGELFTELLLAEKEGRQRSENCMLFDRILVKHGEKLQDIQRNILSSILVFKLLKLRVESKDEVLRAFSYLSGASVKLIDTILEELEVKIGVITYDEARKAYDFVEDATGQNDFNVHFNRVRNRLDYITAEALITGEIKNKLGMISDLQTDFAKLHNIKTNEWSYKQDIKTVNELDDLYFKTLCDSIRKNTQVNSTRGMFIYVYLSEGDNFENVIKLYRKYKLSEHPIILWILDDSDKQFYNQLFNGRIIATFTKEEKGKYGRFVDKFLENNDSDMRATFKKLQGIKEIINNDGVVKIDKRMKVFLKDIFEKIYPQILPFPFEGFTNKQLGIPKKNLNVIAKSMLTGAIDYSWIQVQDKNMRNIVSNVFVYPTIGWGVLNDKYEVQYPTNRNVYKLFKAIDKEFETSEKMSLESIYSKCVTSPIGMNDYSFSLLLVVYLHFKGIETKILYKDKITKYTEWSTLYFRDKGIDLSILKESFAIKVNIEGYLKKYQLICNEIEHESNISRFEELYDKLVNLENENEPPEELTEKVQACHMRLEVGINQLKSFRNRIRSIKGDFNKGIDGKVDYKYLLSALVAGKDLIEKEREVNGHFDIPLEELEAIDSIYEKGRNIIDEHYMLFLKKQRCMQVSNVGPFRKWLERLADNLKRLGFYKYSTETMVHMESITGNLENIRKIQEAVEKCEIYIKVTKPNQYSTQEELLNYQKEGEILIDLIKQNKVIDERSRGKYLNNLDTILKDIGKQLNDITELITKVYDKAFEINSLEEAEETNSLIHELLEKGIRHDEKEYIEIIGRVIGACLNDIRDIVQNVELAFREQRVNELKQKFSEYIEDVDLSNMLDSYIEEIRADIKKENLYWLKSNGISENDDVKVWSAQACQFYLSKTEVLPEFLFESHVLNISKVRDKVMERMKQLKIESVLELFKGLDSEEKTKCLRLLKEWLE